MGAQEILDAKVAAASPPSPREMLEHIDGKLLERIQKLTVTVGRRSPPDSAQRQWRDAVDDALRFDAERGADPANRSETFTDVWRRTQHLSPEKRSRSLATHLCDLLNLDWLGFSQALICHEREGRSR